MPGIVVTVRWPVAIFPDMPLSVSATLRVAMRPGFHSLLALAAIAVPLPGQDPDPPIEQEVAREAPATAASRVRAALGCRFAVLESKLRRSVVRTDTPYGFKVAEVDAGSPAAKAGVEPGWVLLEWEGRAIRELEQIDRWLWAVPAGGEVEVGYSRKKKDVSIWSRRPWESGAVTLVVAREHPLRAEWGIDVFGPADFERPEGAPAGVWVHAVVEGSPAGRAGLRPGDVLRTCGGADVADLDALGAAVREDPAADALELLVARADGSGRWSERKRSVERPDPANRK